ncbi:MAG: hypothetical protein AB7F86_18225 [Bdellovibrionales bacterium]
MIKANPLFVDSTKMTGETIGTHVELNGVAVYEEETLFVLITDHLGGTQQFAMHLNDELVYRARVWLSHQRTFSYQFVIVRGDLILLESASKQARAQHAVTDRWEPVLAEPGSLLSARLETPMPRDNSIPEQAKSLASLIEKFRF